METSIIISSQPSHYTHFSRCATINQILVSLLQSLSAAMSSMLCMRVSIIRLYIIGLSCCFSQQSTLVLTQEPLCNRHVIWCGDLDVRVGALRDLDRLSQSFNDGYIVCHCCSLPLYKLKPFLQQSWPDHLPERTLLSYASQSPDRQQVLPCNHG